MTEKETNEIHDSVTSAIGGIVDSMSKYLEQHKKSDDNESDTTDDESSKETEKEICHRAVEQYVRDNGKFTGKKLD